MSLSVLEGPIKPLDIKTRRTGSLDTQTRDNNLFETPPLFPRKYGAYL